MSDPEAATVVASPTDLLGLAGADLGVTPWAPVTQDQVNLFADATGDHQWIHVDVARATAESPFGGPIAHGYLTLSLVNLFLPQLLQVNGTSMGVNVGLDKVRFPAPVPTGSLLRGRGQIVAVEEAKGGVQATVRVTIEIQGPQGEPSAKPACVADTVSRFFP
ncbi:acyl dehydratase [Actinobacteria bacterium IMCC26207]|nr:acyl dehydratase [Actinobacteria bacterium IMCC26207]